MNNGVDVIPKTAIMTIFLKQTIDTIFDVVKF